MRSSQHAAVAARAGSGAVVGSARFRVALTFLAAGCVVLLSACGKAGAPGDGAAAAPPEVSVAPALSREVTDFDEFTGRFVPVERVEIRPRVSGYISQVHFPEGREVKKGDVLFVIDARPYEAELKRVKAQLAQARTQLSLANLEKARAEKLAASRAISKEEFDSRVASSEQAGANVNAAEAAVDAAQLNVTFTRIEAPINGIVSRAEVTAGNLVNIGQSLLTTIVSIDPIYVEFEGDEQVYLKYIEMDRRGERKSSRYARNPVWIGLSDETGFPHEGVMAFVNNEVDAATGTIRARAELDNKDRRFTPGLLARVRLVGSGKYDAVLIVDSAVGTDQNVKYVFVVPPDNHVQYRAVKLGPLVDGMRVVRSGLKSGETIVISGLQRVRPNAPITPRLVAMGGPPAATGEQAANTAKP
ncbi:MAG: efflux RND transporter periplasmic adaptor subunit [Gammaproteobacteria bacterium]